MSSIAVSQQRMEPGRMSAGAWLLAALLVGEVAAWVVLRSDAQRAVLVTAVFAAGLAVTAARLVMGRPVNLPRLRPTHTLALLVAALIGCVGLALAVLAENEPYYVAADLYHWFIEGLAVALVTAAALGRGSARDAARAVAVIGLLVGLLCVITFILGTLRVISGGTHFVNNLGIARLIVGRGTPQIMLIIVLAALWRHRQWDAVTRWLLVAAVVLLSLGLAVTLKRTLWLSFPVAAAFVVLDRRRLSVLALAGVIFGPVTLLIALMVPQAVDLAVQGAGELLTYNPAFTLQETLARRGEQLESVWPYIVEHPGGHGLGASVYAYWSRGQTYTEIHYIHNLYAYYALQLGLIPLAACGVLVGLLGWSWLQQDDRAGPWGFAVRAGLGSLAALLLNGLSLVPTHTVFAGFALGLGMIGAAKLRREAARRQGAP